MQKKLKGIQEYKNLSEEEKDLVKFIITQHSYSRQEQEEAISSLDDGKQERYGILLAYLKDADKLDRVRLGRFDGLDVSTLSLPISFKLVKLAYQSNLYLFDMLRVIENESEITQPESTNPEELLAQTVGESKTIFEFSKILKAARNVRVTAEEVLGINNESKSENDLGVSHIDE